MGGEREHVGAVLFVSVLLWQSFPSLVFDLGYFQQLTYLSLPTNVPTYSHSKFLP